jgi:hypothetical protein
VVPKIRAASSPDPHLLLTDLPDVNNDIPTVAPIKPLILYGEPQQSAGFRLLEEIPSILPLNMHESVSERVNMSLREQNGVEFS